VPAAPSGSTDARIYGWLNLSAFSLTPAYSFGNVGPSLNVYGPGLYNWDVSMFKTFTILKRVKAQFRAESLNVTNTVLFANPGSLTITTTTSPSNFATITSQTNYPRLIQRGSYHILT
jgi:hypothetical protein